MQTEGGAQIGAAPLPCSGRSLLKGLSLSFSLSLFLRVCHSPSLSLFLRVSRCGSVSLTATISPQPLCLALLPHSVSLCSLTLSRSASLTVCGWCYACLSVFSLPVAAAFP